MSRRRWICPHCGNTDRDSMATNMDRLDHPELTILCEKMLPPEETAHAWQFNDLTHVPGYDSATGRAPCGEQFEPNRGDL